MNQLTIPISGMTCGGCVRNVRQALGALPGVTVDTVSIGSATVEYDPGVTDRDAIAAAIKSAGYVPLAA